jgi:hypothetical protein
MTTRSTIPSQCILLRSGIDQSREKEKELGSTRVRDQNRMVREGRSVVLSGSNARHIVVLRKRRQVLVQLFDALLVRFGAAFAPESLVEL